MGQLWTGIQMDGEGTSLHLVHQGLAPFHHMTLPSSTVSSDTCLQPAQGRESIPEHHQALLWASRKGGGSRPLSCQRLELSCMTVPDLPATGKHSPAMSSWTKGGWVFVGSWQSLSLSLVSPGATVKHLQFPIKCVPLLIPLSPSLQNLWICQRDLQDVLIKCLTFPWLRNSLLVYLGV